MADRFDLALVAVLRNEAPYVEEWIAYHNVVGVEHFFIYENNSDDDIRSVLKRYINHGLVTMIEFPLSGPQMPAYRHAVHCFGASTRWLATIDLDEFIVPKADADVPAMLGRLGDVDRVVLPWRNFGFSGHRTRPPGLVIGNFTMAEDEPAGGFERMPVKSIARSEAIVSVGIHMQGISSDRTVDAAGNRPELDGPVLRRPDFASAQLNHYVTKSEAEFVGKRARGDANRNVPRRFFTVEQEEGFSTPDRSIEPFIEPTRHRLEELRSLSPTPFRYGSRVRMKVPHPDPFDMHVRLSVSAYLGGWSRPTNAPRVVENLAAGDHRSFVARVEERHRGPQLWRFDESPQFSDLVRRLEAQIAWQSHGADPVELPLDIPTGTGASSVHVLFIARLQVQAATTLRWTASPSSAHPETELAEPGEYLCVVEVNRELACFDRAGLAVAAGPAVHLHELALLTYG